MAVPIPLNGRDGMLIKVNEKTPREKQNTMVRRIN